MDFFYSDLSASSSDLVMDLDPYDPFYQLGGNPIPPVSPLEDVSVTSAPGPSAPWRPIVLDEAPGDEELPLDFGTLPSYEDLPRPQAPMPPCLHSFLGLDSCLDCLGLQAWVSLPPVLMLPLRRSPLRTWMPACLDLDVQGCLSLQV